MLAATKSLIISIIFAFCIYQAQADLADDAAAALNNLRNTTSSNLNGGFLEHIKMSTEVDTVALDTKGSVKTLEEKLEENLTHLKRVKASTFEKKTKCQKTLTALYKSTADDLDSCVNEHADAAVDAICSGSVGLTETLLKDIYEEEKKIIHCGRSDEDCLNTVIAEINDKITKVPDVINTELEADRAAVEGHIADIEACAAAAFKKSQKFARRCIL